MSQYFQPRDSNAIINHQFTLIKHWLAEPDAEGRRKVTGKRYTFELTEQLTNFEKESVALLVSKESDNNIQIHVVWSKKTNQLHVVSTSHKIVNLPDPMYCICEESDMISPLKETIDN